LLDIIITNIGKIKNWSVSVLIRELLSPSSHFDVLHNTEITPSFDVALQIIGEVTDIPREDPSLFYCVISSIGPCLLFMLSGAALISKDSQLPPEKLIDHMHRFALAGLQSVAKHHRDEHRQTRNS
jgi:TetR/AcrR family transcriptional regulator, regulator of cefoperazone and chloramphenicol sensitivity